MGLLGDKMLQAGVVSKADADRVHRQEVIEKEKRRKDEERREREEERRWHVEDDVERIASLVINMQLKDIVLEALGFSQEERQSLLLKNPPPTAELLFKLGGMTDQVLAALRLASKLAPAEIDRLKKDPKFLKIVKPHL